MNIQYGWKCPSCGAVMAPWVENCVNCKGDRITIKAEDIEIKPVKVSFDDNIIYTTLQDKLNSKLNFNK